ncbi:putative polygalacturonase [Vitis vinifera]|uniref:Putative polygalacturonase n=1 Tax=Vitis vinifera TaxID=29760 RepID=A0A438E6J1_VITVI|nr:putative polygalacturonase [Vitis vinifera]
MELSKSLRTARVVGVVSVVVVLATGQRQTPRRFRRRFDHLSQFASDGGSQLFVPPGRWLTGSFNLTSHFTLYLHKDAVLLASQGKMALSMGRAPSGGQSSTREELKYTRPYLIEIMHSDNVQISSLTLVNSPSWNVHPVYSSNVIIQGLTITAPVTSPNTDGINPDSCTNTRIEDCYIVSGDDCIAVKSVQPLHWAVRCPVGIEDVRAEDILAIDTESGVRIKTAVGRGGYVKDIYVRSMIMKTMKWAFWMTGNYGSHADNNYDPNALPAIQGINYRDMVAENVTMAGRLEGISGDPFTGICISNVTIGLAKKAKKAPWTCTDIAGITSGVVPQPCDLLPDQGPEKIVACNFPTDSLPIDTVEVQTCSYWGKYL